VTSWECESGDNFYLMEGRWRSEQSCIIKAFGMDIPMEDGVYKGDSMPRSCKADGKNEYIVPLHLQWDAES
jgi:hypothetical protein